MVVTCAAIFILSQLLNVYAGGQNWRYAGRGDRTWRIDLLLALL